MTARRTLVSIAVAASVGFAAAANAEVVSYKEADEIAGTARYFVELREARFSDVANEEALHFICEKDGTIAMYWHIGARYGGVNFRPYYSTAMNGWTGDRDIVYRIDSDVTVNTSLRIISEQGALRALIARLARAKVFLLKLSDDSSSSHFDLPGFAAATGANSDFGRQCAVRAAP